MPPTCSRCHFRAIKHRLESLCDECYEITVLQTRSHRSRVESIVCGVCGRHFKDYHGLNHHLLMAERGQVRRHA